MVTLFTTVPLWPAPGETLAMEPAGLTVMIAGVVVENATPVEDCPATEIAAWYGRFAVKAAGNLIVRFQLAPTLTAASGAKGGTGAPMAGWAVTVTLVNPVVSDPVPV